MSWIKEQIFPFVLSLRLDSIVVILVAVSIYFLRRIHLMSREIMCEADTKPLLNLTKGVDPPNDRELLWRRRVRTTRMAWEHP
jgi:hypothetical protein